MIDRFAEFLRTRTKRERALTLSTVVLGVPTIAFFGVLEPVHQKKLSLISTQAETAALAEWLATTVSENAGVLSNGTAGAPSTIAIGIAALEQSLIQTGLRDNVAGLAPVEDGKIELRFDRISLEELAEWLTQTTPTWGYSVVQYDLSKLGIDGDVAARFTLEPTQ